MIPQKVTLTLSSEEYKKILNSVIMQIRRSQLRTKVAGMKRSSLIQWYMETAEESESIVDEESLLRQRKIIKSVLKRLVEKEHFLLEVRDQTVLGEVDEEMDEDPVLVIAPSYNYENA